MIKLKDILNEIAYPVKKSEVEYDDIDDELMAVTYKFSTKQNDYDIVFYAGTLGYVELTFGLSKDSTAALDTKQMTGEGDVANVLQTVCKAINEFFEEYDDQIKDVEIAGTDEKRKRVYKAYMPKYINPKYISRVDIK
jgi:uncharacterized protein Yka (UPF0111/DUF47 family)